MPSPAMPLRIPRFDLSSPLTAEAEAPRAINTREKPNTKGMLLSSAPVISWAERWREVSCSKLMPVIKVK